jgi:hypothetical protein
MGKSRSEPRLPGVFFSSLRGAEGDAAISTDSPRGREERLARARTTIAFSPLTGARRRSSLKKGSLQ